MMVALGAYHVSAYGHGIHGVQTAGKGYTDTAIEITRAGIRVVHTLSENRLAKLAKIQHKKLSQAERMIQNGFVVSANLRDCPLQSSLQKSVPKNHHLRQFVMTYQCPQGMDVVDIDYQLFAAALGFEERGHYNYVRLTMSGKDLITYFGYDHRSLNVDVATMTRAWQLPLSQHFSEKDANADHVWRAHHH